MILLVQLLQDVQAAFELAALEPRGRALSVVKAVVPVALVAEIFCHIGQTAAAAAAQQHTVQIEIVCDECARDHDGVILQRQQRFHFLLGLVGLAAGQQLDHVKGICVQRHGANLAHHLRRDSAVVCQRSQFFHLVFQKELIVAAAGQQGVFCPRRKDSATLLRPVPGHSLQGRTGWLVDLHAVAELFTAADELLLPLAGAQLAVAFLDDARHHKDGVLGVRQRIAKLL